MEPLFLSSLKTTDECKAINIIEGIQNKTPKTQLKSIVFKNETLLSEIDDVLTSKQCNQILKNLSKQPAFQKMNQKYEKDVRNSSRLLTVDKNVSDMLWQRMNTIVTDLIKSNNISITPFGFNVLNYEWKLKGINEGIRINRYEKNNQFFAYHKDGQFCNSGNERSIFSVVIYLNDNFKGGETNFYFEPDITSDSKTNEKYVNDFSINEEIKYFGGINKFCKHTIIPKKGKAVIFSQNLIHEGCVLTKGKNKYILRTDIIVTKKEKKNIGFAISTAESDDYLKSLNYFREAQQLELQNASKYNKQKCNEFYERSLNIRYSYPAKLLKTNRNKIEPRDKLYMNVNVIWMIIFDFSDLREIELMSYLFPIQLYPLVKMWQNNDTKKETQNDDNLPLYIPSVFYSYGTYSLFAFEDADFFYKNEEQCCKIAAIYAFVMLSQKYKKYGKGANDNYIVHYNPYSQQVLSVPLNELLTNVFYNKKCFGAYFKMNNEIKNNENIVSNNLDRKYMSLVYGAQFVGDTCIDENDFKFEYGQRNTKIPEYIKGDIRKLALMDDNGVVNHIRTDYSEPFQPLSEQNSLNNKNYVDDLINGMSEYQHPSYARVVNINGDSLTLNNFCNCSIHRGEGRFGNNTTKVNVYNQLIFDFTQTKLTVNVEDKKNLFASCNNCCYLHHSFVDLRKCLEEYTAERSVYGWGWGHKEFGRPIQVDYMDGSEKHYKVNIERLFDSKFDLSFYHACSNMVSVAGKVDNEKTGIDVKLALNYTHLNHIHLASLRTNDGRVLVWAAYNGVAAL